MLKRLFQLGMALTLLVLLGGLTTSWAESQTGDEWMHGEFCAPEGQGPVTCP